jgi:hypothetical protein
MNSEIITILKQIEKRLESIEKRMDQIDNHLGIVKQDCSKMGEHIDFVEHAYSILRKPLNYLLCKKKTELPTIKNEPIELK